VSSANLRTQVFRNDYFGMKLLAPGRPATRQIAPGLVETIVEELGFDGALAVSGGWWSSPPGPRFRLPRWNVPAGLSVPGFELRAAGFWCR
jgi:hypothetical protein